MARTALVVEDADDAREMFAILLRDAGFRVECAESVQDALRILRTRRGVDVIVADYKLGDGTGAELFHQASNEGHLDASVTAMLLCTAYRYVELPPHVTMVHKPIDPKEFLLAVAHALGEEHVA